MTLISAELEAIWALDCNGSDGGDPCTVLIMKFLVDVVTLLLRSQSKAVNRDLSNIP